MKWKNKINPRSSDIAKLKFNEIFNRSKTINIILKKKNKVIFDVGANIGQSLYQFSKDIKNISQYHCFEPNILLKNQLLKNINKYKPKNCVSKVNFCALGKNNKKISFFINKFSTLSSFFEIPKKSNYFINKFKLRSYQRSQKKIYVNQIKLDDYVKKNKINSIDILKIDTQGYDIEVLKGAKNFLKNNNINVVVTELLFNLNLYKCQNTFNEIEKILGKNYILWDISFLYKNPKYKCLDYLDAIYVNKNIIPEFNKY
jgi:FkbM family methyltransferase